VIFSEFLVTHCKNLKYIKVITTKDTKPQSDQQNGFATFAENLKSHSITFCVEYSDNMHDRQVM
jgi:Phospholipase D-like domain at C-terminus of MIT